jgi:hypothetical protein
MKPLIRIARAAAGLIVILLAGCDNVSWGGADVAVVPPPPRAAALPEGTAEAGVEPLPREPGPVLRGPHRDGAFMTPVGEIPATRWAPIRSAGDPETYAGRFIAEFMRQGGEFTLFSRGARAGTFIVQTAMPQTPSVSAAAHRDRHARAVRAVRPRSSSPSPAPTRPPCPPGRAARDRASRMRFVAPILAERMLRARAPSCPATGSAPWRRSRRSPP